MLFRAILFAGVLIAFSSPVLSQEDMPVRFSEARPSVNPATRLPDFYMINVKRQDYTLSKQGKTPRLPGKEAVPHIQLKMDRRYDAINRLYYAWYRNHLIVVFEGVDIDSQEGASYVARIDLTPRNPKTLWTRAIEGFNIGEPVVLGQDLYLTSIGYIARITLDEKKKGDFVWQHEDLFDQQTEDFSMFRTPEFDGDKVIFYGMRPDRQVYKRIEVDRATGKILGIFDHLGK